MGFKPGQSGNPSGRPKLEGEALEVRELARAGSVRAIGRLIELVEHEDGRIAQAAANSVLDRAFGKPTQPISGDDDRPPIQVESGPSSEALALLSKEERGQLRTILGGLAGRSSR